MTNQSPEERRLSSCDGKQGFTLDVARQIARRDKAKGRDREAYKCEFCRLWHVGGVNSIRAVKAPQRFR